MTFFFYQRSLLCLIIFFSVSFIFFHHSIVFAQGQNQSLEKDLGLFVNGNTSLLNDVFNKVKDSVVQITTEYDDPNYPAGMYDSTGTPFPMKFGSGFVYDDSGTIITNYHVVSSATNIVVTFNNGNSYTAKVVGLDPYGDISILRLDDPAGEKLVPVTLSNSSDLNGPPEFPGFIAASV